MSAIRRIISVSVASATVIGLIVTGGVAPPTGRRPRGTNDNAPLPKLGPLISSLLKAIPQQPAHLQAAVTPVPPVPGAAVPQSPNVNQAVPEAVPVPPAPPAR